MGSYILFWAPNPLLNHFKDAESHFNFNVESENKTK